MTILEGKVAVITGAASGIGAACAQVMARKGAKVVVSDLTDSDGEAVAAELREEGGEATFIACDISNHDQVQKLMEGAVEAFGSLDIGVNNAGIGGDQAPVAEYPFQNWQQVIDVNLTGAFLCMKEQIPRMLASDGGAIINVASILGQVGFSASPAYTAAKHGLVGLTRTAALDYSAQGIRVVAVGPAFIDTPMIAELKESPEIYDNLVGAHPIGRLGRPEEVANLVAFLASDEASFITGSYHAVDGAYLAQ